MEFKLFGIKFDYFILLKYIYLVGLFIETFALGLRAFHIVQADELLIFAYHLQFITFACINMLINFAGIYVLLVDNMTFVTLFSLLEQFFLSVIIVNLLNGRLHLAHFALILSGKIVALLCAIVLIPYWICSKGEAEVDSDIDDEEEDDANNGTCFDYCCFATKTSRRFYIDKEDISLPMLIPGKALPESWPPLIDLPLVGIMETVEVAAEDFQLSKNGRIANQRMASNVQQPQGSFENAMRLDGWHEATGEMFH